MNILHAGNPYFAKALTRMGHTVITAGILESSDLRVTHPANWDTIEKKLLSGGFKPELVIYADNGNFPYIIDPEYIPCLSIFYSIDTYCNPWHVPFGHGFDFCYVAQKDYLPLFVDDGQRAAWMPLFAEPDSQIPHLERDIPVSFVGTLEHKNNPERKPFLLAFNECLPLRILSGDFRQIFAQSKIVLNQTAIGEINFRCFEAMACGAALLMEKCGNGLLELFTPGIDILPLFTRNNASEAASIASIYLKKPFALAQIAENGRALVMQKHTDYARAETILGDYSKFAQKNIAAARLANPAAFGCFTRAAFGIIAAELQGERWDQHRDLFAAIARGNE